MYNDGLIIFVRKQKEFRIVIEGDDALSRCSFMVCLTFVQ